ncbi:MAG: hypothetical protein IPK15_20620 [Verrucomicrobia bacterium]|nr:hypothetical protein [Verrucomicrobiota bacterium]
MKIIATRIFGFGVTLLVAATATVVSAQDYSIDWHSTDGGGGTSTGGGFSVSGTVGQPDANTQPMTNGGFSLTGGFWSITVVPPPAAPITIFDNLTGSDNGIYGLHATTSLASKFCLGAQSYQLDSVTLLLNSQGSDGQISPPSTVRLQIYSHNPVSGKPAASTGLIMNLSGLTNPITPPRGFGLVKWTNATPFRLAADTCYWVVVSRESGGNIGQIASFTLPTGDAGGYGFARSGDSGATWLTPDHTANSKMLIQGVAVETPGAPQLSVEHEAAGARFRWTRSATGFVLEQSLAITGAWSQVTLLYTTNGTEISFTVPAPTGNKFYRLRKQ